MHTHSMNPSCFVTLTEAQVSQVLEVQRLRKRYGRDCGQTAEYWTEERWKALRYKPSYSKLNVFIDEPPYNTVWRRAAGQFAFDWIFPPDLPASLFTEVNEVGDPSGSFIKRIEKFTEWTQKGKMRPGWTLKLTILREFIIIWPDDIKAAGRIGADFFCDLEPIFDGAQQIFWPWPQRIPFEFNAWVNGLQPLNFPNHQPANHPISFCLVECYLDLKCLNECYSWIEDRRERLQLFRWFISQIQVNMALFHHRKLMLRYQGELPCRFLAMEELNLINSRVSQGALCSYRTLPTVTDWFTGQEFLVEGCSDLCREVLKEYHYLKEFKTYYIACKYEHKVRTDCWYQDPSYLHSILAPDEPLRRRSSVYYPEFDLSAKPRSPSAPPSPPPWPRSPVSSITSRWGVSHSSLGESESVMDVAVLQDLEGYDNGEETSMTETAGHADATDAWLEALRATRISRRSFHRGRSPRLHHNHKGRGGIGLFADLERNIFHQKHSRQFYRGRLSALGVRGHCCRRLSKRHRKFSGVNISAANCISRSLTNASEVPKPNFKVDHIPTEEELSVKKALLIFVDEPPYTTIFRRFAGQPPFERDFLHDESWLLPTGTVVDGFDERFAVFTEWTAAGAMRPNWTLRVSRLVRCTRYKLSEFIVLWEDDLRGAGFVGDALYCDLLPIFDGLQQLFWPWPQDFATALTCGKRMPIFTATKQTFARQGLGAPSLYSLWCLVVMTNWIDRHDRLQVFRWLLSQAEQNWVLYTYSCRVHGDKWSSRQTCKGRQILTLLRQTFERGSAHMYRALPQLGHFGYIPYNCAYPPLLKDEEIVMEVFCYSPALGPELKPTMPESTARWVTQPIFREEGLHLKLRGDADF